jgi:hypothetical protein
MVEKIYSQLNDLDISIADKDLKELQDLIDLYFKDIYTNKIEILKYLVSSDYEHTDVYYKVTLQYNSLIIDNIEFIKLTGIMAMNLYNLKSIYVKHKNFKDVNHEFLHDFLIFEFDKTM